MIIYTENIVPSQDFLKPETVKFIFECIKNRQLDMLPPAPIVREGADGKFVAIDGHNLIAVKQYLGENLEVHIAKSADDGISETTEADRVRNYELREKFNNVLEDRLAAEENGVRTFADLIAKYPELFKTQREL